MLRYIPLAYSTFTLFRQSSVENMQRPIANHLYCLRLANSKRASQATLTDMAASERTVDCRVVCTGHVSFELRKSRYAACAVCSVYRELCCSIRQRHGLGTDSASHRCDDSAVSTKAPLSRVDTVPSSIEGNVWRVSSPRSRYASGQRERLLPILQDDAAKVCVPP